VSLAQICLPRTSQPRLLQLPVCVGYQIIIQKGALGWWGCRIKVRAVYSVAEPRALTCTFSGATCYLNSLLQTLYLDPIFRRTVYEWRYDEAKVSGVLASCGAKCAHFCPKDLPSSKCIPFQLQLLFAQLQIGDNGIAKTGMLTDAFGWTNGEQYQQHDVQELMRVLLNAVEVVSLLESCFFWVSVIQSHLQVSFKEKLSDADSRVTPVYSGSFEDYLQCQACGHRRSRVDPFMDVQLFIERANTLQEALATFVTPEVLDGGNQIKCEGCNNKVDAKKGLMIRSLPQVSASPRLPPFSLPLFLLGVDATTQAIHI
jgi:hypothetical protein